MYNLSADRSESVSLLPGPGPDSAVTNPVSAAAARARDIILAIMQTSHVENPYWKSSKNVSDKCCNSCFSPGGCKPPCKYFGPPPSPPSPGPPSPPGPAPPGPPLSVAQLVGTWLVNDSGGGNRTFTLAVSSGVQPTVTLTNTDDASSCWTTATGQLSANNRQIVVQATGPKCTAQGKGVVYATGDVRVDERRTVVVDVDYPYAIDTLSIRWSVRGRKSGWPLWTRTAAPMIAV